MLNPTILFDTSFRFPAASGVKSEISPMYLADGAEYLERLASLATPIPLLKQQIEDEAADLISEVRPRSDAIVCRL